MGTYLQQYGAGEEKRERAIKWIILGWVFTWAAVELNMLQRLLDTTSLTGGQWLVVLALSLVTPALLGADTAVQLSRSRRAAEREVTR